MQREMSKDEKMIITFLMCVMIKHHLDDDKSFFAFSKIWGETCEEFRNRCKFDVENWISKNELKYRELEVKAALIYRKGWNEQDCM